MASTASDNNETDRNKCNLIVNYLPQSIKEKEFAQLFAKLGPIRTSKLMHDKQTGMVVI
jgi:RNA recognition motif-containing protein